MLDLLLEYCCRHFWSEVPATVRVKFLLEVAMPSLAEMLIVVVTIWSVVGDGSECIIMR